VDASYALDVIDLCACDPAEHDARLRTLSSELVGRSYDLATGPLVRAMLVILAAERHVLLVAIHHIAFDGSSVRGFCAELQRGYQAYTASDREAALAAWQRPALLVADLAHELDDLSRSPSGHAHADYWNAQLAGAQSLELPIDHSRDEVDAVRASAMLGL